MKIAIVGSHCVGKSTLAKGLVKELNCAYIPDVAVEAFEKNFVINENTPAETQFWILSKQLEYERNLGENWVSDKSLLDNIVYGSIVLKDKQALSVIKEIVRNNLNYDLLFYLPIEFPLVDDGIRSMDPKFQKDVDERFLACLSDFNLAYHTIQGGKKERLKRALEIAKPTKK